MVGGYQNAMRKALPQETTVQCHVLEKPGDKSGVNWTVEAGLHFDISLQQLAVKITMSDISRHLLLELSGHLKGYTGVAGILRRAFLYWGSRDTFKAFSLLGKQ